MKATEYQTYDATGLAALITAKEVSHKEVIAAALETIEAKNPTLNAIIHHYDIQKAMKNTKATGPFTGVPMLLKGLGQEAAGELATSGTKVLRNQRAKLDSSLIKKFRETGVTFLGTTNVPEFALVAFTEPELYGPTRNPWNTEHTPGGSSGGAAAAVASGMVPIAGANDGGGSIRIPAAYSGLFGLKPTRGRTPTGSSLGRSWQGASVDHVLTRSVRDSATMLDALASGFDRNAAYYPPPTKCSYATAAQTPFSRKCRIAFTTTSPIGTAVDQECVEAVLKAVHFLEKEGHIIEEKQAPVDGQKLANAYMTLYFGETAASLKDLEAVVGRKVRFQDVEPATWVLAQLGKVTTAEEWVTAFRQWDIAAAQMEDFHDTYDFYITPTTAMPPAKIGELKTTSKENQLIKIVSALGATGVLKKAGLVDEMIAKNLSRTPFTQLANMTGQPAMSLPLHVTASGLPTGVQVMAAKGREDLLFQLASLFEQSPYWQNLAGIRV